MLVIRQNADTYTIMSQEFYSSASSDDQSSINSVVHVGDVSSEWTEEEEEDGGVDGGVVGPGEEEGEGEDGGVDMGLDEQDHEVRNISHNRHPHHHHNNPLPPLPTKAARSAAHPQDSSSDSDDDDEEMMHEGQGVDSDSSSSSEGTQVWVPVKSSPAAHKSSTPSSAGRGATSQLRHSVVSHSSTSGRAETSLAPDDHHAITADSGISNESADQVSTSDQLHGGGGAGDGGGGDRRPATHIIPMPALHSPTHSTHQVEVLHSNENPRVRESLFNILSGLYALLLVTLGAALPIADVFAAPVAAGVFEIFYIYLTGMSIVFLLYVYTFLLSERTVMRLCRRHHADETRGFNKWSRRVTAYGSAHMGSFYLRLGAVAFGIGSMIHEGLMFGELFEFELSSPCVKITEAIRPVLQLAFTFIQLYFIFLNSKMCIHKYRTLARFGLTHMVATNLCIWFRTVAKETIRDVGNFLLVQGVTIPSMQHAGTLKKNSTYTTSTLPSYTTQPSTIFRYEPISTERAVNMNLTLPAARLASRALSHRECPRQEILSHVVEEASPYLYSCTIQYSIIAAGILYVMWSNISKPPPGGFPADSGSLTSGGAVRGDASAVDCSGANRGLFLGIFTLVASIISTIVFFVLVERPEYIESGVVVVHVSEIVLYTLASISVVAAAYRTRQLRFHPQKDNVLDEALLLVALAGQFIFCVFGAVAGQYNTDSHGGTLVMATSLVIMLQATLQTVFILNALRRSARQPFHENNKPGREYITFLLMCNIAMWGVNTFEALRSEANPITLNFYGFLPWSIMIHISSPLAIFYRFHSTVCLAHIWKNAYRQKLT